jgi:hypothetical protein
MHSFSNEEKKKWFEDYNGKGSTGARKRVEDTEATVQQEQEDMKNPGNAVLKNREPEKTFWEMMLAMGHRLSVLGSSDDEEDREHDNDKETEQGKLSEDDEPSWVMDTITKTVKNPMERFCPEQIKLHE